MWGNVEVWLLPPPKVQEQIVLLHRRNYVRKGRTVTAQPSNGSDHTLLPNNAGQLDPSFPRELFFLPFTSQLLLG